MTKMKLTSIRIDEEVNDAYAKLAHDSEWWSRSTIMVRVLEYVITHHTKKEILKMVRGY